MDTSGGNPTIIGAPDAVIPFSNDLREILTRLVITCDKAAPLRIREFSQAYQRYDELFKPKLRIPEIIDGFPENRTIGRRFHVPSHIPEVLLNNTFLALSAFCEYRAQF